MTSTIMEDILDFVNANRETLGLPVAYIDYIGVPENSLAIQSVAAESVTRSYIDGTCLMRISIRFALSKKAEGGSSAVLLESIEALQELSFIFSQMHDFSLPSRRVIRSAEAVSTPSIISRDDKGNVTYGVAVTLNYVQ